MDPLTHAVAGALTASIALPGEPRIRAAAAGAGAGVLPDIDLLPLIFMDELAKINFHRGPTHSLLFVIAASLLLGVFLRRRLNPAGGGWPLAMLLAMGSHLLIDCFTSYGTMLFLPFSSARAAWYVMGPIDPFFTLPAAGALALFLRVGARRAAMAGALFMAVYLALAGSVRLGVTRSVARSLDAAGMKQAEPLVTPTLGGPFLWNVVVHHEGRILAGHRSVFDRQGIRLRVVSFRQSPRADRGIGTLEEVFDAFTGGNYAVLEEGEGPRIIDLRYGFLPGGGDTPVISYRLMMKGRSAAVERIRHRDASGGALIRNFFCRISGCDRQKY